MTDADDDSPLISPEALRRAGTALFGEMWFAPLAYDLGVSVRACERWAAGTQDPPPGLASDIIDLCQHRAKMVRALAVLHEARARAIDDAAREIARALAKRASV